MARVVFFFFVLCGFTATLAAEQPGRSLFEVASVLNGEYDLTLAWSRGSNDVERPAFFTALQEQLRLKLEPIRGPVEVLVIDAVQRPSPD